MKDKEKIVQTAGRDSLTGIADEFAKLNDDVLFEEVWNRHSITTKERCIITIVSLISKGILDSSLSYHIQNAKNNGVSLEEISEIVTHIAFYAGWPNAWAAFRIIKEVYKDEAKQNDHGGIFGIGEFNEGYKQYFIGNSYLKPLTNINGLSIANVTFEPGCRNNWHIHHATKNGGQILICVEGEGYYQEEGKDVIVMHPGDVISCNANIKHWHGSTPNGWFSHLAIAVPGENCYTEWLEPISDDYYNNIK